jgi:hypothetical protein
LDHSVIGITFSVAQSDPIKRRLLYVIKPFTFNKRCYFIKDMFACLFFNDYERLPEQDRQQKLTFLKVVFHFRQPEKCLGG